jgi:lipid II:glycine glycyltransferase (peptidoglycan interpeptide bridge formation enzyme)
MRNVQLIDPVEDPRWDQFVMDHPFGWICHLSGWKQVLEKSFKHMKGYYFALVDEDNRITAGLPIYEVKSKLTGNRLVSIPFATLCDPLVSNQEDMDMLFQPILELFKNLKSKYIKIGTLFSHSLMHNNTFRIVDFYKHHYLSLDSSTERLKKKFHRTCVRQRISRAEKSKLKITPVKDESGLNCFYQIFRQTRKRLGLPLQPYRFLRSIWKMYYPLNQMSIFLAKINGKTIAGLLLFKFKDRVSAEIAASKEEYNSLSPNHYLFWQAIQMAHEEGYRIFDFGRTSPKNTGLMDFKKRWGTQIVDLSNLYYPCGIAQTDEQNEESKKYKIISQICKIAPEIFQGIIGNFCYRHLG